MIVYSAPLDLAQPLLAGVWWYVVGRPLRTGGDLDPGMARYNFFRNLGESREPEVREAVERSKP